MSNGVDIRKDFPVEKVNPGWGVRHVQSLLMFFVMGCAHGLRTSMAIAIIAMTDTTTPKDRAMTFDWPKSRQDFILSSFYWGYMVMQLPSGYLSHRFGGKLLVIIGLIGNGLTAMAIPEAAKYGGWQGVCLFRGLQGVAQGCLVPSVHTLLGKWSPIAERSRMGTFIYTGSSFGILISMPASGFLSASDFGWPGIFYSFGIISILTGVLHGFFGADSPATHKSISSEERKYIEETVGNTENINAVKVPWKAILTSSKVLALVLTQGGCVYGVVMLQTEIPSYLKMAHKVDVKNSALLNVLPVCVGWIFAIIFSQVSDTLVNRKIFTLNTMRKTANTFATWIPAVLMAILTTVPAGSITLAVGLLTLIAGFETICCSGFILNHIDLSPRFAGTLMSLSNFAAAITSQMAPLSAAAILDDPNDISQWRWVFFLSAGISFISNLIFITLGTTEKQPWDSPPECKTSEETPAEVDGLLVAKIDDETKIKPLLLNKI